MMVSRSTDQLTPIQHAVLDAVYALFKKNGRGVTIEEISAETLLSPDAVVRATTVLAERNLVQVQEPQKDETELLLEVAGAGR